jgi:hypothetical protein
MLKKFKRFVNSYKCITIELIKIANNLAALYINAQGIIIFKSKKTYNRKLTWYDYRSCDIQINNCTTKFIIVDHQISLDE